MQRSPEPNLFAGLDAEERALLLSSGERRLAQRGERLFQQGDPARYIYHLESGRAKLTQVTPEGQQILLHWMQTGDILGGMAVLGGGSYPATAEIIEDAQVRVWDGDTMRRLMRRIPGISINALNYLVTRVHELQSRITELTTERAEQRIARALLRLAETNGRKTEQGVELTTPITRQEIAELTGTTLYTVSRTLSRWQGEGLVEAGRRRVHILRLDALGAVADDLPRPSTPGTPHR